MDEVDILEFGERVALALRWHRTNTVLPSKDYPTWVNDYLSRLSYKVNEEHQKKTKIDFHVVATTAGMDVPLAKIPVR